MRKLSRSVFVGLGMVVALGLSIAGAAPIAADTPQTHTGVFGVHYLADSAEYPAATCSYNSGTVIASIRVRAPFVYARNTVAGTESQAVSWQFAVQARPPGTNAWSTVATSAIQKKTTTDARVADFTPLTRAFSGTAAREYRVVVIIRWYGSGGTSEVGRIIHRADWYAWTGVPSFHGLCPGGIF
jgi:hypothetical protein